MSAVNFKKIQYIAYPTIIIKYQYYVSTAVGYEPPKAAIGLYEMVQVELMFDGRDVICSGWVNSVKGAHLFCVVRKTRFFMTYESTILYCYSFLTHEPRQPTVLIPCLIDLSNCTGKGTHHSTDLRDDVNKIIVRFNILSKRVKCLSQVIFLLWFLVADLDSAP